VLTSATTSIYCQSEIRSEHGCKLAQVPQLIMPMELQMVTHGQDTSPGGHAPTIKTTSCGTLINTCNGLPSSSTSSVPRNYHMVRTPTGRNACESFHPTHLNIQIYNFSLPPFSY
jgi:hypothetical protein